MNKIIVAIYDRGTESYGPPMVVNRRGEAIRSLKDALTDPNSAIARHPKDYDLYQIGTYNDQTGVIEPCQHEMVARAEDHTGV